MVRLTYLWTEIKQTAMKKIIKSLSLLFLVLMVPVMTASGQDNKNEKKIKVIIDDGSGAKVIIDTVFTKGSLPDSIALESGKVIYFDGDKIETNSDSKHGKVTVLVTSDGENEKKIEKRVIVSSGDTDWSSKEDGKGTKHIYAYSTTKGNGETVTIISDGKDENEKGGKHVSMEVNGDRHEGENEMTKYVIARNGVVVTVECNDEAKAKDLIREIENKLGSDKSGDTQKNESKKNDRK
jgi:hypothetical protein